MTSYQAKVIEDIRVFLISTINKPLKSGPYLILDADELTHLLTLIKSLCDCKGCETYDDKS